MGARALGIAERRSSVFVAFLMATILGLGLAASFAARGMAQARAEHRTAEALTSAGTTFVARIANAIVGFDEDARSPIAGASSSGLTLLDRRGERFIVRTGGSLLPAGSDIAGIEGLAQGAGEIRDGGLTRVQIVRLGSVPRAIVMVPLFGSRTPPAGTAERRARLTAIALGDLEVARVATESFGTLGARVTIADHGVTLFQRGSPTDDRDARTEIAVRNRVWTIAARPDPQPVGLLPWLFIVLALAIARIVVVTTTRDRDRARRAEQRATTLADENTMITEVGALLQATPDLAETLPSVVVRVVETLGLEAMRVSVAEKDNEQVDLFVYGRFEGTSDRDTAVPLVRAGRRIGALTVRWRDAQTPRSGLDTIAGLLSAAMANARAFEAERALVERLRGIDQLKTEFLATVSHEIRTPLVSITGFAQLLTSTWDDLEESAIKDYVSRIDRNASALSRLLQQVLDFSRLERGRFRVAMADLDLTTLLREVLERDAPMLEHHRLEVEMPDDLMIRSDPAALEQIANNLISNAVKFSPPGSRVSVAVVTEGEDAVLTVDDEGPGIPPEERERVFQRFYRGGTEAALRTRGAGIGLAIVSELVASLRGSVRIETSPSGGARFVVRLPRGVRVTAATRGAA